MNIKQLKADQERINKELSKIKAYRLNLEQAIQFSKDLGKLLDDLKN